MHGQDQRQLDAGGRQPCWAPSLQANSSSQVVFAVTGGLKTFAARRWQPTGDLGSYARLEGRCLHPPGLYER